MRVLICGGRTFANHTLFRETLDKLQKEKGAFTLIIQGGAKGADYLAHKYAASNGINEEVFNAQWQKYGKAAGYIRNKLMLTKGKPDLVVAFPGNAGTAMMVKLSQKAMVEVIEVSDPFEAEKEKLKDAYKVDAEQFKEMVNDATEKWINES